MMRMAIIPPLMRVLPSMSGGRRGGHHHAMTMTILQLVRIDMPLQYPPPFFPLWATFGCGGWRLPMVEIEGNEGGLWEGQRF